MNKVKKSIATLCCHLNLLFDSNFTTEDFCSAKFDKNNGEIVPKFWKLLNMLTINTKEIDLIQIKSFFKSINYRSSKFYSLPDTPNQGSKELLIAFSFVFCDGIRRAIERKIKNSPFNRKYNMSQDLMVTQTKPDLSSFACERDFIKYSDWMKSRINLNSREICELQQQNARLFDKIRNSSLCFKEYSMNEILALKDAKYAKIFLEKTEKITKILTNHQEWTENESVFWQWMVSVVKPSPSVCQNAPKSRKMIYKKKTSGIVK